MCAAIAQLVEQGTENPCVLGSIPSCGTIFVCNKKRTSELKDFKRSKFFYKISRSLVPSHKRILNCFVRQSELRLHFCFYKGKQFKKATRNYIPSLSKMILNHFFGRVAPFLFVIKKEHRN